MSDYINSVTAFYLPILVYQRIMLETIHDLEKRNQQLHRRLQGIEQREAEKRARELGMRKLNITREQKGRLLRQHYGIAKRLGDLTGYTNAMMSHILDCRNAIPIETYEVIMQVIGPMLEEDEREQERLRQGTGPELVRFFDARK